jgi:hypothetical protein
MSNEGDKLAVEAASRSSDGLGSEPKCMCLCCLEERDERIGVLPYRLARMVVCPICGDKRCPHCADHRNECTGKPPAPRDNVRELAKAFGKSIGMPVEEVLKRVGIE